MVGAGFGRAQNGTWTNDGSGVWSASTNWLAHKVAAGSGATANFSTIDPTADRTVTLDSSRSIGTLLFGDPAGTNGYNWTLTNRGNSSLTLAVSSGAADITVNTNTATISLPLLGTAKLTKGGAGTLILAGTNRYNGATTLNAGVTVLAGVNGTAASSSTLTIASTAGTPAIAEIVAGARVTNYSLAIGENATGAGALYQSGGNFTLTRKPGAEDFRIGDVTNGYGYYLLSGGTLQANDVAVGGGQGGVPTVGVMDITGGTFNDAGGLTVGRGGTNSSGALNISGSGAILLAGTVSNTGVALNWGGAPGAVSVINIFDGGTVTGPTNAAYQFDLSKGDGSGSSGILNLNSGGSLTISSIIASGAAATTLVNCNGGILKAARSTTNFISANVGGVFSYGAGAMIDDGGNAVTISNSIQVPAGCGVSSIPLANGGSGYIGAPLVTISGGAGQGATAIAQLDLARQTITNLLVTCPGTGYASGDILNVAFAGGGGAGAAAGTPALAANSSGGLTKLGDGTLTLAGASTYAGATVISGGTLVLGTSGSVNNTSRIMAGSGATLDVSALASFALGPNQSLLGSGTNNGSVGTAAGSRIYAGTDGGYGTNTFRNNLIFVTGALCCLDLGPVYNGANDQIVLNGAGSVLNCGGASIGINCGATLDQTNDYTLFNLTGPAAGISGSFNPAPVWLGAPPANAGLYFILTQSNKVVLHYNFSASPALPVAANLAASNVAFTNAVLNGQVLATGSPLPTVRIYYGTSDGGTNPAAWANHVSLGLETGSFSAAISALSPNTTYYFAVAASNSAGTVVAQPSQSFTTRAVTQAAVANLPAANVQGASAVFNGQVLSIGSQAPGVTLFYGTNDGSTNAAAWNNNIYLGQQNGNFAVSVTGLTTNTTYYYTAFANNGATVWASPSASFTTRPTAPLVSVLTYHYNNARTAANTNETELTPATVNVNNFGRLWTYPVDGYVYTQPLYVPNVNMPGLGTHNVIYIGTEHDTVYALDADSDTGINGGVLWHTNLGVAPLSANGEFGLRYFPTYTDLVPEVGITATPVIDPASGTMYVDVLTREVGSGSTNYHHRLHALNITNGTEQFGGPMEVAAAYPGRGVGGDGKVVTFNARYQNERPALTLAGGKVFAAYASFGDANPYHGWVIGFNATNLQPLPNYVFNTTPNATTAVFGANAAEGGIWMGGDGLCVDANTNLYFETGNGSFSANTNGGDYADSFIKLATTNGLTLADYFTPYNQAADAATDADVGSAGPLLLPDSVGSAAHPHLIVGASKQGTIYLVDRDNMGAGTHYNTGSDSEIVQSVIGQLGGCWSAPAYFNNHVYFQPSGDSLKAFLITNGVLGTTPSSQSGATAGNYSGSPVISANGTNNAILWQLYGGAYASGGPAILFAYDANNLSTVLYASQSPRDNPGGSVKMINPTVANGKVYVGAEYALSVYGYATFLATPAISPNGSAFAHSVLVTLSDATPGASVYYTEDGATPTTNSILYTAPFAVSGTVNLQAVAIKAGAANSGVASASFVNTAAVGSGTGLLGQYWSNTVSAVFTNADFATPATLSRTDPSVNFNWTSTGPAPAVGNTNFTVRWTGSLQPQYSETYTLTTVADDGVRVWVNGQLLINAWTTNAAAVTNSASLALNAQQLYTIQMDYFQSTGNAVAQLLWSSPSTAPAIVPQTQLYPYTNPPPAVVLTTPANGATFLAAATVSLTADADAAYNPLSFVNFYTNGVFLGSAGHAPYALTATGWPVGNYTLTATATDGSGLTSTSAPVSITVTAGSGLAYGLTTNAPLGPFLNQSMPGIFNSSIPALLSQTGAFVDTPNRIPTAGLVPYVPNTPLWSDNAVKSRYLAVPNHGGLASPAEQIGFAATGSWTFPAGTVFVKNFDLVVNETNPAIPVRRLETRLLVRDTNGAVYGATYKWLPDNSDAQLLAGSLTEAVLVTNAAGVITQNWYYPSPADCLACHTKVAGYVLGVNTRQLNGVNNYSSTGATDNQLRALNRLGMFYPAFNEANIAGYDQLASVTNPSAPLVQRARSYLDANCAQCHQPGGTGITFDARYDTPLPGQNISNYPAAITLGYDNARIIAPNDVWRSVLYDRMNTTDPTIKMPNLARNLIDSNAVATVAAWINSLGATPALAPPVLTPASGLFTNQVTLALQPPDPNAALYYTLDGTLPTTNSTRYAGPFNLNYGATVMANAFESNYINSVAVTGLFTIVPPLNSFFAPELMSNGAFQMQYWAPSGQTYILQASSDLINWIPVSTNTPTAAPFNWIDPGTAGAALRFYRVVAP